MVTWWFRVFFAGTTILFFEKKHHKFPSDFVNVCAVFWRIFDFPSPPHTIFWGELAEGDDHLLSPSTLEDLETVKSLPTRQGWAWAFIPSLEIPSPSMS